MSFHYGVALFLMLPLTLANRCTLPIDAGPCLGHHKRWAMGKPWHHSEGNSVGTPLCVEFIYGGCKGNENNFGSRDECQTACPLRMIEPFPSGTMNISSIMRDDPMSDAGAGPGGARGDLKPVKPKTFQSLPVVAIVVILGCCLVAVAVIVLIINSGRKRRRRLRDDLPEVTAF